jgi:Flp pilus assembly protein TadG
MVEARVTPETTTEPHLAVGREDGSAVVETAVIVPIAMLVILLAVQVCLWAHAATVVQGAATAGAQVATVVGGTSATGESEARSVLTATGRDLVMNPSVTADTLPGGVIEIKVSGTTESVIPWLQLPVSATRVGLSQQFRESG